VFYLAVLLICVKISTHKKLIDSTFGMHLEQILFAIFVLLTVAALFMALSAYVGLGSILGLLATGFIVGPSGLAITQRVTELRHVSELGVVLLLFVIGLEMRPEKLWSLRRVVFGLGSLQVVVTGLAIAAYASLIHESWKGALLLGLGLALSSTAFVVQILEERGDMATEYGTTSFGILLFQDMAIVPLLALVPLLSNQVDMGEGASFLIRLARVVTALGGVIIFGRIVAPWLLDRLARQSNTEVFNAVIFIAVIGAALAMELAGLSMALGTFLMGMFLSGSPYRHQIETVVQPFKRVLLSLFFVSVGMSIDAEVLASVGPMIAAHMLVLLMIKAVLLFGLSYLFGVSRAAALRVAFLLPQCGEFGFVLFGAAVTTGLMTPYGFAGAVLLISMSMVATPLLARLGDKLGGFTATNERAPSARVALRRDDQSDLSESRWG
jgi:glutathione-regulated potassium-efflux system ancillary protein KefC